MKAFHLGLLLLTVSFAYADSSAVRDDVTFYRDVLPVLQKHCQRFQRPGQIAPMNAMHTAFDIPNTGPDAVPRESIEARFFAFFD